MQLLTTNVQTRSPLVRSSSRVLLYWIAGSLAVIVLLLWGSWLCSPFVVDDAFISFRYAENLVRGQGLVYNPGEHVEGYTNFLWVMLIALINSLGGDSLLGSKVVGTAANAITLLLVALAARRWWPDPALPGLPLVPCLLLVANYGFVLWGVGGLETSLFTCLLFAGLYLLINSALESAPQSSAYTASSSEVPRRSPARVMALAALLFALATLARPDGAVFFGGALLGILGWTALQRQLSFKLVLQWAASGSVFVGVVGAHELFRIMYYGELVPNTALIKVPQSLILDPHWHDLFDWLRPWGLFDPYQGGQALAAGVTPAWWQIALGLVTNPVLLLVFVGLWTWKRRPASFMLAVPVGVWLLYLMRINDDWMPGWRYFVPVLPAMSLLFAGGLEALIGGARRLVDARRRAVAYAMLLTVVAVVAFLSYREFTSRIWEVRANAAIQDTYREAGQFIRAHAPRFASVAVVDAGAIPYYSRLKTIDYAGLADKHMARVPFQSVTLDKGDGVTRYYPQIRTDPAYLLSRRPTLVQLSGHFAPDGHLVGHYPELMLVYEALQKDGSYDLAHPVYYDPATTLIIVKRKDAAWRP